MYKLLLASVGLLFLASIVPLAVIAFDAPVSPPPMASMAESLKRIDSREFPAPAVDEFRRRPRV